MGARLRQLAKRLRHRAQRLSQPGERLSRRAKPPVVLASPRLASDVVACKGPQAPCDLAGRHRRIAQRRSHEGAALPLEGRTLPLVAASPCKDDEPLSSSARRRSTSDEARRTPYPPRCADHRLLPPVLPAAAQLRGVLLRRPSAVLPALDPLRPRLRRRTPHRRHRMPASRLAPTKRDAGAARRRPRAVGEVQGGRGSAAGCGNAGGRPARARIRRADRGDGRGARAQAARGVHPGRPARASANEVPLGCWARQNHPARA